jgi:hypothetical protein
MSKPATGCGPGHGSFGFFILSSPEAEEQSINVVQHWLETHCVE